MWFVSIRYQGASVNKDAFIFSWLTQHSFGHYHGSPELNLIRGLWVNVSRVCENCAVYCPLFGQKRACEELILVFLVESSSASVAEHGAACSNLEGHKLVLKPKPEHGSTVFRGQHGFAALHCEYWWCSILVGFSPHLSIRTDGFGGITSFHRALVPNDVAAIAPLKFHGGPEALTTLTPSFQI